VRRTAKLAPAIVLVALALPASAFGQASRTWVSGVGDDANPCSRTAPCKTFAGAISKTATGGEINCLDPGGFGGVTITKGLTIKCQYTEGGVLVSGTNAIVVNAPTTDKVILRGLDINGLGTGLNGVRVLQAKSVTIIDSEIYGFTRDGVDFETSNGGAKGVVVNSHIHDNTGNGVLLAPTAGTGKLTLRNNLITDNGCGVAATNHLADPAFNFAANCGTQLAGAGGGAKINAIDNSIDHNDTTAGGAGSTGVFSNGQSSIVRIGNNDILNNINSLRALDAVSPTSGIYSFGDNHIAGNSSEPAPTGTISHS
jgi:hypothetical protein